MAEKKDEKRKLTCINIDIAKNGYELRCSYEPKKSLSQRAGWVPSTYEEPTKYVAKNEDELIAQIKKVL